MKGKKVLALLTCTALLAGSLTACGNAASTTAPSAQEPQETSTAPASEAVEETPAASNENAADDSITGSLTIWEHGTGFENSLAAVIEGFQKKYPNVEVEYEIKDGDTYYSLLTTAIQSGEAPDLFWTNGTATTNMQDYVKNDVLMDISDLDFSALTEDSMKLATINDTVYSVPWLTMDTRACFYNKDLFTENGWEIPSKFSEFEDLLAKQKEAGVIPISFSPTSFGSVLFIFEPVLSAMDPEYTKGLSDYSVKLTDQPAKDALNKMLEWADKGYYGDNYKGVIDGSAAILTFTTGKAAMFIGGSWEMSSIESNNPDLNYGAFQIPAEDGTTGMVGTCANGFSIYKDTKSPEAAKAFAQYCASLEAQTTWVQVQRAVSGSPEIQSANPIANEISNCDNVYTSWQSLISKYSVEGGTGNAITEEYFPKLFVGDITVDQLMDDLGKEMQ